MENNDYEMTAEKILEDLGLKDLKEPERSKLLEVIKNRIEQKTLFAIMKNLKDEDIKELDKKLEAGADEGEAIAFMASRVPNLKEKISTALAELYDDLVEDAKKLMGK